MSAPSGTAPPPGLSKPKSKPHTNRKPAGGRSGGGGPHNEEGCTPPVSTAKRAGRSSRRASTPNIPPSPASATPSSTHKKHKSIFKEHWSPQEVQSALETGAIFIAAIRCNPSDRTQGFCSIPGLPHDIFIRGWKPQNRAIEGDQVALRILPTTEWYRLGKTPKPSSPKTQPFAGERGGGGSRPSPSPLPDISRSNIMPSNFRERVTHDGRTQRALVREMTPPVWALSDPHVTSDGLVASPALMPSPSGGELDVALEQDPLESENESTEVDDDYSGIGSMAAYVVATQLEGTSLTRDGSRVLATPAAHPNQTQDQKQPWAAAGSPAAAIEILSSLLAGQWEGWRATAEVVAIVEPSSRRTALVGVVRDLGDGLQWDPCDPRLPRAYLQARGIAPSIRPQLLEEARRQEVSSRTLVGGALVSWAATKLFPTVAINRIVGRAGGIEAEIAALLAGERIEDDDQFTPAVLECLPKSPWKVTDADVEGRRDLRHHRIFSIDPPTARDLDDALSVEELGDGMLRIGVHIADVSHFVRPGTALDSEASMRSTSVYLIDRVIPMLPRPLCEELCSLNPGVDRLAMSIIWDMTKEGKISETWVGRTIIRSCAKLSYPMVQAMIDAGADAAIPPTGTPAPDGIEIHGPHSWPDIVRDSMRLHSVASEMRRRRFEENGALRLDNSRIYFHTDDNGMPVDFGIYEQKEANRLVEEFMLAANMSAARIIAEAFPERALLRCHPSPNSSKMAELAEILHTLLPDAPPLEIASAGALQKSLHALRSYLGASSPAAEVVTMLCTKPMQNARYFCTGDVDDSDSWRHYALSVSHYTHFTSPIRRYPDVVVHRLLMAAKEKNEKAKNTIQAPLSHAGADELPTAEQVSAWSIIANERKMAAKAAQDGALRVYLAVMLLNEPRVHEGVVSTLGGSRFFDVFVPALGVDVRVHTDGVLCGGQNALAATWNKEEKILSLDVVSGAPADACEPHFDDIENAALAVNPEGLDRMAFPITLRPLCTVKLLVGARRSRTSGSPSGIHAKLWLATSPVATA